MKTEIKIQIEVPEGKELEDVKMENGVITPVFKDVCPFKEGDIIVDGSGVISMFYRLNDDINPVTGKAPIIYSAIYYAEEFKVKQSVGVGYVKDNRLATEEEKHKFFTEAAKVGYEYVEGNWIRVPIIKDGDFIVCEGQNNFKRYLIYKEVSECPKFISAYVGYLTCLELDVNVACSLYKCRLATEEEKRFLINKLNEIGYIWDDKNRKVKNITYLSANWREWAGKNNGKEVFYIDEDSDISPVSLGSHAGFKNSLPTKDLAKAVLALNQLLCLRDEYRQGWKPDWNTDVYKYVIEFKGNDMKIQVRCGISRALSFPTRELTEAFVGNFRDLILGAKELL